MPEQEADPPGSCSEGGGGAAVAALALAFRHTSLTRELHTTLPLVCRAWSEAADEALGCRPAVANSLAVGGRTASLAAWLRRHGQHLAQLQLSGFRRSVDDAWWRAVLGGPRQFAGLWALSLRACGSPGLPLELLAASAPALARLQLEHAPSPPSPGALAALRSLTHLTLRSCGLALAHLQAVGSLVQLEELRLARNSFVPVGGGSGGGQSGGARAPAEAGALPAPPAAQWASGLARLRALDLTECALAPGLLEPLVRCTALTRLQLCGAELDASAAAAADRGAAAAPLQRLQPGAAAAPGAPGSALVASAAASAVVLARISSLRELDVSLIPNAAAQLSAGARGQRLGLTALSLTGTGCDDEQLARLAQCCPRLRRLDVSETLVTPGGRAAAVSGAAP